VRATCRLPYTWAYPRDWPWRRHSGHVRSHDHAAVAMPGTSPSEGGDRPGSDRSRRERRLVVPRPWWGPNARPGRWGRRGRAGARRSREAGAGRSDAQLGEDDVAGVLRPVRSCWRVTPVVLGGPVRRQEVAPEHGLVGVTIPGCRRWRSVLNVDRGTAPGTSGGRFRGIGVSEVDRFTAVSWLESGLGSYGLEYGDHRAGGVERATEPWPRAGRGERCRSRATSLSRSCPAPLENIADPEVSLLTPGELVISSRAG
jgi:hypothetical protein